MLYLLGGKSVPDWASKSSVMADPPARDKTAWVAESRSTRYYISAPRTGLNIIWQPW